MGGAIGNADGILYGSPLPKIALAVFNGGLIFAYSLCFRCCFPVFESTCGATFSEKQK